MTYKVWHKLVDIDSIKHIAVYFQEYVHEKHVSLNDTSNLKYI